MEIYLFAQHMLAWSITIAVLGFVAFPWAIVAYKIWHGNKEIEEEMSEELLVRSWYMGWSLGVAAIVFLFVDWLIVEQAGVPAGPVHVTFFIGILAVAAGLMLFFFYLEDFFQGLMLAVIYLFLPTAVFYVLWWLIGWNPLFSFILSWLTTPTA